MTSFWTYSNINVYVSVYSMLYSMYSHTCNKKYSNYLRFIILMETGGGGGGGGMY